MVAPVPTQSVAILLPAPLVEKIDALVGEGGREALVADVLEQEVERRLHRVRTFQESAGALAGRYPEWDDAAAWVHRMRYQSVEESAKEFRSMSGDGDLSE